MLLAVGSAGGSACGRSIPSSGKESGCGICGSMLVAGACGKSIGGSEPRSCAGGTCWLVAGTTGAASNLLPPPNSVVAGGTSGSDAGFTGAGLGV